MKQGLNMAIHLQLAFPKEDRKINYFLLILSSYLSRIIQLTTLLP